jgi:predicted N-acetyltransferase YhbS
VTIEIRPATAADGPALARLNAERNGAWTGPWVEVLVADDEARARWRVAADGDRVVAGLVLLPARWALDGVDLAVTQVEFVATHPDFEGRGLVRRLIDEVHALAAAEGGLVQLVTGIPYFYRQFGYEYAVADLEKRVPTSVPEAPAGWTVRPATPAEIPVLEALAAAEVARSGATLVADRSPHVWDLLFASPGFEVLVAVDPAGRLQASARVQHDPEDGGYQISLEHAAGDAEGTRALLAHLATVPVERRVVAGRPGTRAGAVIEAHTEPDTRNSAYPAAVRVADPVALLDRLRPVLSRRLAAGGLGDLTTTLTLTAYRWTARLTIADGTVTAVDRGPRQQDPLAPGTIGVPPDRMAALLLGPEPATTLEARNPDVVLGEHRMLADVLFPGVDADLRAY